MADYSEFPTTPTAWQERAWQEIAPLETEDPPAPRRSVDLVALIPGLAFVALAIAPNSSPMTSETASTGCRTGGDGLSGGSVVSGSGIRSSCQRVGVVGNSL